MKKLTKILSFALLAVSAFMLAACGAKTEAPATKAPVATTTKAPVVTTKAPVVTTKAPTTVAPTTTVKPVEYYENALLKGDFENLVTPRKNLTSTDGFIANWGNFTDGIAEIVVEADGNHAIKLQPKSDEKTDAIITGEFGPGVVQAGEYKVQASVKVGSAFAGSIVYGAFKGSDPWVPGWKTPIDLTSYELSTDTWTTIEANYTLTEGYEAAWVNFDFGYVTTAAGDNSYILVDNITVLKKGEGDTWTKADTNTNNGFEGFDKELILDVSGWKAGSFIYVEGDSLENSLPQIEGNTVMKIYGTNQKTVKFNLAAGGTIVLPDDYKVTMKVKLGEAATNVSRIEFLFFGDPRPVLETEATQFDLTNLTDDGWATIDAYFTVTERTTSAWVNMYFMVDLNNDEIQSTDNYILIDDVEICQAK